MSEENKGVGRSCQPDSRSRRCSNHFSDGLVKWCARRFACRSLVSWVERQPLKVSTNQHPVPDVVFPKRSLERVLFSKYVSVDKTRYHRK